MAYPADPLQLRVRIAPGDSVLTDPTGWTWVDISSRVRTPSGRPTVSMAHGGTNAISETFPAGAELVAENADGFFGVRNPLGLYYGEFGKDTPLDIAVNPGSGWVTRFTGGLADVPRETSMGGRNSWVTLVAQGALARVAQRGEPLQGALVRYVERSSDDGLLGFWALADPQGSRQAAGSLIRRSNGITYQTPPMTVGGSVQFGQDAPPSGVSALVNPANGYLVTTFPVGEDSGEWRVQCLARGTIGSVTTQTRIASWLTRGSIIRWDLVANDGVIAVHGYDAQTVQQINITVDADGDDGRLHLYWVDAYNDFGTLTVELWIDGVTVGSDTLAATTTSQPTYARIHPDAESLALEVAGFGAWMPRPNALKADAILDAAFGWNREYADTRITRTAEEEGIRVSIGGTGLEQFAVPMGPQASTSLLENWRIAEKTGRGVLFDATNGDIRYRVICNLQNQDVRISLSHDLRQTFDPLLPAEAGQMAVNDVTVRGTDGTTVNLVDQDNIDLHDRHSRTYDVNPASTYQLQQLASWNLVHGTWDEEWYDNIRMQLAHPAMASKVADWLAAEIGDRVQLPDLPLAIHPQGTDPDLILRGYTEEITLPRLWVVDMNCSPYGPYQVGVLGTDKLGVGRGKLRYGARLAADVSSSATSMSFAASTTDTSQAIPRFTTTGGHYPTPMMIGGELINVTAMAAATTITFIAAGTAAHADDASVVPGLPAGMSAGNLMVLFAAARNTGIDAPPAGWTRINLPNANFALMIKIHTGSESAPTVTFAPGAPGNSTSAQIAAFTGSFSIPGTLVRMRGRNNASAQNIAYQGMRMPQEHSGSLVLWLGHKRDNWTSVASPGTEIGEPSTALGSNQGLVWAYQIQTTPADVAAGSFVVTGGTAQTSASAVVALRSNVQVATVQRSQNRIVKAHSAGAGIELASPIRLGITI